jgi:hypothetical protein
MIRSLLGDAELNSSHLGGGWTIVGGYGIPASKKKELLRGRIV